MALQKHEDIEQHMRSRTYVDPMHMRGPYAPACPSSIFFGVLPRTCVGGESEP